MVIYILRSNNNRRYNLKEYIPIAKIVFIPPEMVKVECSLCGTVYAYRFLNLMVVTDDTLKQLWEHYNQEHPEIIGLFDKDIKERFDHLFEQSGLE